MIKMTKKIFYLLTITILLYNILPLQVFSQDIPEKPVPPRLVNDFTGMLNQEEINSLSRS